MESTGIITGIVNRDIQILTSCIFLHHWKRYLCIILVIIVNGYLNNTLTILFWPGKIIWPRIGQFQITQMNIKHNIFKTIIRVLHIELIIVTINRNQWPVGRVGNLQPVMHDFQVINPGFSRKHLIILRWGCHSYHTDILFFIIFKGHKIILSNINSTINKPLKMVIFRCLATIKFHLVGSTIITINNQWITI